MEERGKNGVILSIETTTIALMTEVTGTNEYNNTHQRYCDTEVKILLWLYFIFDVIGMAGNAAVIWLLGFWVHRNAISVYILNLAVADFFYLSFNFIMELQFYLGPVEIYVYDVFHFVFLCCYIAGLSFLSVISLERCLSVLCPIWYRCHRPGHASSVMCVIVWVLSLIFTFLQILFCLHLYTPYYDNLCMLFNFSTSGYLLFLFVILSGSSLALAVRMFCGSRRMPMTRLYVTVLLSMLVFICCGMPYGIVYLLIFVVYNKIYDICYIYSLLLLLTSINSCANPIIYFFVGSFRQRQRQRQRQTLQQVLQRALQDTPEDEECEGSLSQGTLELSGSRVEQ